MTRNFGGTTSSRSEAIFTDQDLFQPLAAGRDLRLDHFLDAFEMSGKTLARTWCSFRLVFGRVIKLALDRREAGLDLLEGEGHLFVVDAKAQSLGTGAMLGALQNLQDRCEIGNPLVGTLLHRRQSGDLSFSGLHSDFFRSLLARHRENHRFQRVNVVRQVVRGHIHGNE